VCVCVSEFVACECGGGVGGCGGHQNCTVLVFCAALCPHMRVVAVAPIVFKNYITLAFILFASLKII